MAVDRKSLCPNCGAPLSGLEIKCPECGYVLTSESFASQNTTDSLLSLQEKLLAVDKVFSLERSSKKKASIINSFPIPNTAESLIRLLHYSYSNYEAAKEAGDKKLSMAWLGKAIESYRRLSGYNTDTLAVSVLEQYKELGSKKAFSKLSGSRRKKVLIVSALLIVFGIATAFILWFDWAGMMVRNGKDDLAVRLLTFMGRRNQAIEILSKEGRIEGAVELLSSDGQNLRAVSLLAQKGMIKEALILTGKSDSADSIHAYVNEINKYSVLKDRGSYYPTIDDPDCPFMRKHYDADSTEVRYLSKDMSLRRLEVWSNQKEDYVWYDYLGVMKDLPIPEPTEFEYPYFLNYYYALPDYVTENDSLSTYYLYTDNNKVAKIELVPMNLVDDFIYSGSFLVKELITYKGIKTMEVIYEYGRRGELLSSINYHFLLSDEEIERLFSKEESPSSQLKSRTLHYDYSDGRLKRIRETLDHYKDFIVRDYQFEYYGNVRFRTITNYDTKGKETVDSDVSVEYTLDGSYVESFVVSL